MKQDRRKFLQQLAAVCGAGVARSLGVGMGAGAVAIAAAPAATAGVATAVAATSAYGTGVRQQVFEVIVRQAMAGAPWQDICKGPMNVNKISEDDVIAEVKRRRSMGHTDTAHCYCEKCCRERHERYRRAHKRVDEIPHSALSPCACKDCRFAVNEMLANIWKAEVGIDLKRDA